MKTKSKKQKRKFDLKNNIYGIRCDIKVFNADLSILIGNKDKAIEYVCEKTDMQRENLENAYGFCYKNYVYVGPSTTDYNAIVHELTHGVLNIFAERDIYWTQEKGEHEVFCYTIGYVVGYVLETKKSEWYLRKNKKWIKQ